MCPRFPVYTLEYMQFKGTYITYLERITFQLPPTRNSTETYLIGSYLLQTISWIHTNIAIKLMGEIKLLFKTIDHSIN